MGVIPMLLGAVSKPLEVTYKLSRLALRLKDTRKLHGVADIIVTVALDLKGKVKLSLTILLVKLIHGKVRCQQLAAQTCRWLEESRAEAETSQSLHQVLNDLLSPEKEPVLATASPLTRAGLLFLLDCGQPLHEGDKDVIDRFKGPRGQLDVHAALTAFYGTATAYVMADALKAPNASCTNKAESLLCRAYDDLRYALRRDLTEMFLL